MKLNEAYRRTIGIFSFLVLLGIAIYCSFFIAEIKFDNLQLTASVIFSFIIFFGMHYITLTSFGFLDSNGAIAYIPPILQSLPVIVLIVILLLAGSSYIGNYRLHLKTLPLSYDQRQEIMNAEEVPLIEKFEKLELDLTIDSVLNPMKFSFSEQIFVNSTTEGLDLDEFYDQFSLSKNLRKELSNRYINFADTHIKLTLANGRTLNLNDSDSILGYLQSRDVFIQISRSQLYSAKFESISRATGERLPGIPLMANSSNKMFADIHYRYQRKNADFQISIWQRFGNGEYILRQHQIIPLGMYHNAATTSVVKNIRWKTDSLLFDFVALDQNKVKQISFCIY